MEVKIKSKLPFLFLLVASTVSAGEKKKPVEAYAVVAGTVFRDPGFALPGAQATLSMPPEEGHSKIKKLTATSDSRGEFAFRVSTEAMVYTVRVTCRGYSPQEKKVSIEGEQRVDATFTLSAESK